MAVFVLLMNGRHVEARLGGPPVAMTVTATPIPLDSSDPARRDLGPLRYLGGWELTASYRSFGGISSLHVDDAGHVIALNDTGEISTFEANRAQSPGVFRSVPDPNKDPKAPRWRWDSESMAMDPVTGKIWVGYELNARICRYGPAFSRYEGCATPKRMEQWPQSEGIESLARLPDGRFLAIAENAPGPGGAGHDVLLFAGDPVSKATPAPARLTYMAPDGYWPTDALAIGKDRLLVMNRRVTLSAGFTGVLTIVNIADLHAGTTLRGTVVAQLAGSIQHDNYEALAMSREGGRPILWIASDDNHLFFQRSLLLKFAMPNAWFH